MVDAQTMAGRSHGFTGLGDVDPGAFDPGALKQGVLKQGALNSGGPLRAFAAHPARQIAIRGDAEDNAFMAAAAAALGRPLPLSSTQANSVGDQPIFRLGPDHWLAVDGAADALDQAGSFHALDVSSARSRLRIIGGDVRDLLNVGCRLDLRRQSFPAGAFAQTPVGNATAILHARADDAFDVYIARSFAESWLVWLCHAGAEFGLTLAKDNGP